MAAKKSALSASAVAATSILVNADFVDNGNNPRSAGEVIMLGFGPTDIDPDRAAYLVAENLADYGATG